MNYSPLACIWELTMGCNLRCGHCGSSCADSLAGELTTEEALKVCDDIAELNLQWITLSGGEPLIREDWHLIAKKLSDNGTAVYLITNALAVDEHVVHKIINSNIQHVSLSIDGTKEVHDTIRTQGCYEQCEKAFSLLNKASVDVGAVTTVVKKNLHLLPEIRNELKRMNVKSWQLQIGIPMGNLAKRPDWIIEPRDVNQIIEVGYEENMNGSLEVLLADCIGYYTRKEIIARQKTYKPSYALPVWAGCNAGIRAFGILHNGDVVGCTSIRNSDYVEGNVKERRLIDIWNDPNAFAWNRKMQPDSLEGYCKKCMYVMMCRGGCSNMRLAVNGRMESENIYCVYNEYQKEER